MNSKPGARVALIGLGPIGIEVGKALAGRDSLAMLGAADPAPDKAGRPLSELLGGAFPGTNVRPSATGLYGETASSRGKADVVLLCTGSRLHTVLPQIEEAIDAGFHVVSTCEELAYPEFRHLPMARQIDRLAKRKGVAVLGTGVNPGLVMDRLVLAVASACVRVDSVRVTRVVDAAKRRGPLRAKVGAGLTRGGVRRGRGRKEARARRPVGVRGHHRSRSRPADPRDHRDDQPRHCRQGNRRRRPRPRPRPPPGRARPGRRRSQGLARPHDGGRRPVPPIASTSKAIRPFTWWSPAASTATARRSGPSSMRFRSSSAPRPA